MKEKLWVADVLEVLKQRSQKECDIVSPHGRLLYCAAHPDSLIIKDHNDTYYQFAASIDQIGTVRIGAYTRKPIGYQEYECHPDLLGGPLFMFMLQHFESSSRSVKRIHDVWLGQCDQFGNYETNYDLWSQAQKNAFGLSDEERNMQAVSNTVSAKIYFRYGFTPDMSTYHFLPEYEDDPAQISVFFYR